MGKTLRKFSRKGKKTQVRRKTKGKKPTRRKSVRRNKFKGGDASLHIKTKVDEAGKLVFKKPETPNNLKQAKKILEELSEPGQPSCSTLSRFEKATSKMGFGKDNKDQACENAKFKEYMKALFLLHRMPEQNEKLSQLLVEKTNRGAGDEEISRLTVEADKELQEMEMYELIKENPDYYLDETNGRGLDRLIIDVFEKGKSHDLKDHQGYDEEGKKQSVLQAWLDKNPDKEKGRSDTVVRRKSWMDIYTEVKAKFLKENPGVLKENPRDKWCRENPHDCANIKKGFNRMNQPKNRSP